MRSIIVALASLVAFLAVGAVAQQCSGYTSCSTCTPIGGCGWCSYSGTCEAGNATGSFVGCTGSYWTWLQNSCPATPAPTPFSCAAASSCTQCTSYPNCGWCSFINQCQQGNATGSVEGCTSPYWDWTNNQCAPVTTPAPTASICSGFYNCQTCTAQAACGWCASTGVCQQGNATGPFNSSCYAWDWLNSQCTAVTTPAPTASICSGYTMCQSCTGVAACGWCASTGVCQQGNATGPFNSSCNTWDWLYNQCTAPTSTPAPTASICPSYYTCQTCTAQAACGWCASTGVCQQGNSYGPVNNGTCAVWDWVSTKCTATAAPVSPTPVPTSCSQIYSCSGCVAQAACGWCATTGLCESGNNAGPFAGTCPSWDWTSSMCAAQKKQ